MKKGVIILGSSNSHGETYKLCNSIQQYTHFPIIDLRTKNILPFDYEFKNQEDDFLNTFRTIVDNYELIIFATTGTGCESKSPEMDSETRIQALRGAAVWNIAQWAQA